MEITYGLERILMAMQRVAHFRDIRYSAGVAYGELFMQSEVEMSHYNLEKANVADLQQRFALFDAVRCSAELCCAWEDAANH